MNTEIAVKDGVMHSLGQTLDNDNRMSTCFKEVFTPTEINDTEGYAYARPCKACEEVLKIEAQYPVIVDKASRAYMGRSEVVRISKHDQFIQLADLAIRVMAITGEDFTVAFENLTKYRDSM